jgi:SOS-response transcriptional repressor LexA
MSPHLQKVLRAVHDLYEEHGVPPTVREICARVGWQSPNAVNQPLHQLRDAGWIEDVEGGQRAARCVMPTGLREVLVEAVKAWRNGKAVSRAA